MVLEELQNVRMTGLPIKVGEYFGTGVGADSVTSGHMHLRSTRPRHSVGAVSERFTARRHRPDQASEAEIDGQSLVTSDEYGKVAF